MRAFAGVIGGLLIAIPTSIFAQQQGADAAGGAANEIEELTVTAQRIEQNIQQVPIAVTALSGAALEESQVINPSDLQLNAPNVSFTATNFGGFSFSIRGIGNLVIGRTGEPGVSSHLNEIAVATNLNSVEFFDMERVEVLRGPQGTLFGRNATGGAINFVTKRPNIDQVDGFIDVEVGDYDNRRWKGALNIPLGKYVAARVSAYKLDRGGYTENLAFQQTDANGIALPGIDNDLDGRDILALRATLAWDITENASAWLLYSDFTEDDDRARITNQVCVRNPLPTTGCLPNAFGWQKPHLGATTAGIFAGLAGALPLGADGSNTALYAYPRPALDGFRQMHTDFEPVFQEDETIWALGADYNFDKVSLSLTGATRDGEYLSRQDMSMDVGATLASTAGNPAGIWPISSPAGGVGEDWLSETCNLNNGTAGVPGGCILPAHQNRAFDYDQVDSKRKFWTVEAKLRTSFDGPLNFLVGASRYRDEDYGGYYVFANTLDLATVAPPAVFPAPLYPGFFYNANDPESGGANQQGDAVFGELYYDLSERLTLTAGLRVNDDDKFTNDSSSLLNSADASAALGGLLGADPIWIRNSLFSEMSAMAADPTLQLSEASLRLLEFHSAGDAYASNAPAAIGLLAAVGAAQRLGGLIQSGALPLDRVAATVAGLPLSPLLKGTVGALLSGNPQAIGADAGLAAGAAAFGAIAAAVPPVPGFNETRFVTGSPTEASWREVSGRLGFDYRYSDDVMFYGFFNRGYKPGGFNPAIPPAFQDTSAFTFGAEKVNAFEVGMKSMLLDGRLLANASFFMYDYAGLQVTRVRNNNSINENIDADLMGVELEGRWRPAALQRLTLDFAYGWLDSAVSGSESLDPVNRTAGNADYILLNNIDPGSLTGVNYIARESQISNALIAAAAANNAVIPVTYPANSAGVAIPAYFSRRFLDAAGVETLEGIPTNLDGNELPNAPTHSLKLGAAYAWNLANGSLTARWDWYWQSESYAREFNTVGDEIDAWAQHNVSAIYENGPWTLRAWVRNVLDDDNVTGKFLTADTVGFYRNYFLTEPRIYGLSVRFGFGE